MCLRIYQPTDFRYTTSSVMRRMMHKYKFERFECTFDSFQQRLLVSVYFSQILTKRIHVNNAGLLPYPPAPRNCPRGI